MPQVGILEDCRPMLIAWTFSVGGAGRIVAKTRGFRSECPDVFQGAEVLVEGPREKKRNVAAAHKTSMVLFHGT